MKSNPKEHPKQLYELVYGYVHCIGKTTYHAGFSDCVETAEKWVRQMQSGDGGKIPVPETDPIRWCPVRHCHMKAQKPWFGYRLAHEPADNFYSSGCRVPEESGQVI